jgi:hypothetical protein
MSEPINMQGDPENGMKPISVPGGEPIATPETPAEEAKVETPAEGGNDAEDIGNEPGTETEAPAADEKEETPAEEAAPEAPAESETEEA